MTSRIYLCKYLRLVWRTNKCGRVQRAKYVITGHLYFLQFLLEDYGSNRWEFLAFTGRSDSKVTSAFSLRPRGKDRTEAKTYVAHRSKCRSAVRRRRAAAGSVQFGKFGHRNGCSPKTKCACAKALAVPSTYVKADHGNIVCLSFCV